MPPRHHRDAIHALALGIVAALALKVWPMVGAQATPYAPGPLSPAPSSAPESQ